MLNLMRMIVLVLAILPWVGTASAAVRLYQLDGTGSQVGFSADSGAGRVTGKIPVADARLRLDFSNLANSSISVTLNARGATANTPFAAEAMRGPSMLDTAHYPTMSFRSTAIKRQGNGVQVTGDLTMRGVTKAVTLQGSFVRLNAADPNDLDHLRVRLSGAIRRSAYGAAGWSDTVGDVVRLDIVAQISRAGGK